MKTTTIHHLTDPLLVPLRRSLTKPAVRAVDAAVAYVQSGGTLTLHDELRSVVQADRPVRVVAGVDMRITSAEGLRHLIDIGVDVSVYRAKDHAMHGKIVVISDAGGPIEAFVGSANWTRGGLIRNSEFTTQLIATNKADRSALDRLLTEIKSLRQNARALRSPSALRRAIADFQIPSEEKARSRATDREPGTQTTPTTSALHHQAVPALSKAASEYQRSRFRQQTKTKRAGGRRVSVPKRVPVGAHIVALRCELNDVNAPNTPGELRLPVTALQAAPGFWGYPAQFVRQKRKSGNYHERRVRCRFTSRALPPVVARDVRVYYYVERDEFRITSHEFRERGSEGDIAVISFARGVMQCRIVRVSDPDYAKNLALCTNTMPSGGKSTLRRWGVS